MVEGSPLVSGVHVSALGAGVLVLLLVAVAHFGLRWYLARRLRRQAATAQAGAQRETQHWLATALLRLVAPVALLLWIYGLHYALSVLLADIGQPAVARYGLPGLDLLRGIGTILALIWLLARVGQAVEARLRLFAQRSRTRADDFLLPIAGTAIRLLLPLLAVILGSSMLAVPEHLQALFRDGVSMLLVAAFGYVLYRLVNAACELLLERFPMDVADNRQARAVRTQVTVLRKVAVAAIVLFAFAGMLMVFDEVRQIGATILASAGVAGIVIGFAAQRSLGTLLAGFQIALTQPIRIDDVVIVEGEWGRIEEITLTYVVVGIWDQRRLIVPITYFLEKPFQNWTRTSPELLGTVELFVDYDLSIEALRAQLDSLLEKSRLWDRRVKVLQVTDAREHTVQIRALVSAANAGNAWDLRCEVREGLLRFLQQEHPHSLPRMRLMHAGTAGTGTQR
ncbi:MAG TPA: mechanosensitive ion channel domain-containing protein [Steroidobacteraceae bacterium]|nr:mechanosensitive ion channel domain-containing protein [Steroidobacteraceae bacterium]